MSVMCGSPDDVQMHGYLQPSRGLRERQAVCSGQTCQPEPVDRFRLHECRGVGAYAMNAEHQELGKPGVRALACPLIRGD